MAAQLLQIEASPDLVERVYRRLMDAISDGSLAPGERITQEEIAQQLAVSRQPVLQAQRLLKKDGFLHDAPGRGLQVAPLEVQRMRDLYQARGDDVMAMIDADLAFHKALYQAAGNPLIYESARLHWSHLRRVMGAVLQQSGQRDTVWVEHQAIADAIAAGDPERAAGLIEEHSRHASEVLGERLQHVLNPPTPAPRRPS